jgi:hypothetical protein
MDSFKAVDKSAITRSTGANWTTAFGSSSKVVQHATLRRAPIRLASRIFTVAPPPPSSSAVVKRVCRRQTLWRSSSHGTVSSSGAVISLSTRFKTLCKDSDGRKGRDRKVRLHLFAVPQNLYQTSLVTNLWRVQFLGRVGDGANVETNPGEIGKDLFVWRTL